MLSSPKPTWKMLSFATPNLLMILNVTQHNKIFGKNGASAVSSFCWHNQKMLWNLREKQCHFDGGGKKENENVWSDSEINIIFAFVVVHVQSSSV